MSDATASNGAAQEDARTVPTKADVVDTAIPADAEGWRGLIVRIAPRDLLRIFNKDKVVAGKIFAGFRPGADTLRRGLVVQRVVELAQKDGKWAKQIAELAPHEQQTPTTSTFEPPEPPGEPASIDAAEIQPKPADPRLQTKLKQQRASLRDKDAEIASLEAQIRAAESERDAARRLLAEAEADRRSSEAEAERERRHRQRADRRDERAKAAATLSAPKPQNTLPHRDAATAPSVDGLLMEGLHRMLSRGKYAAVADLCRETVSAEENETVTPAGIRGRVRAVFAASLYGLGNTAQAATEDQAAASLLLDSGELHAAAVCLGRIVVSAPLVKAPALAPQFRRLLSLADKLGQLDTVGDALTHVRIASPEASKRLSDVLKSISGSGFGKIYARLMRESAAIRIGPDEEIALPTASVRAASVSPRRIVNAFEYGDGPFISECRAGIRLLQSQGGEQSAIAKALLSAVAALDPLAVVPFGQAANQPIVVDASNVARHNPDPLSLAKVTRVDNLLTMRSYLIRRGFFPVLLIADANLRFKVDNKLAYLDLIVRGIVKESPPGTSADEELLSDARRLRAPVITNDRLTEWGERSSGIERLGFVIERDGPSLTPF